jgi:hypothetical protein
VETHLLDGEGVEGFNSSEDARHCSVLYICKYFVHGQYGTRNYRTGSLILSDF